MNQQLSQVPPPASSIRGGQTYIVHHGFDGLDISYKGNPNKYVLNKLEEAKQAAKNKQNLHECVISLADQDLSVKPHGAGRFAYALSNHFFHVTAAKPGSALPMVQVQVKSEACVKYGAEEACKIADAIASDIGEVLESWCSRADLCMDFTTTEDIRRLDRCNIITRAKQFSKYCYGAIVTGFVAGLGGDVVFRLYNKLIEIRRSNKEHWREIWLENGWNGEGQVYRCEFQLRRLELRKFGLITWADVVSSNARIWQHYTEKWVRVVIPSETDSNNRRWHQPPWWQDIAGYFGDWPEGGLTRIKRVPKSENESYVYRNGFAPILAYMAERKITDMTKGIEGWFTDAIHYHGGSDGFYDYLRRKFREHAYKRSADVKKKAFFVPNVRSAMEYVPAISGCPF